jgi:hypothetical protein
VNTKKGDKMLGDYQLVAPTSDVNLHQWSRIQDWLIHPKIEDLKSRPDFTREEFIEFCKSRFAVIRDKLLSQLGY